MAHITSPHVPARQHGLTLVEFVAIAAVILVVLSLLSTIIGPSGHAREKARQATCTSQVRMISMACAMYAQDTSRYPGKNWVRELTPYLGNSAKMFTCPTVALPSSGKVNYGYNGLLVDPAGRGISAKLVSAPDKVGSVCDVTPSTTYPTGGLLGGGAGLPDPDIDQIPSARHSKGTIVGYTDGHAKYSPGIFVINDYNNELVQAFYHAQVMGYVDNSASDVKGFIAARTSAVPIAVGGEFCTRPLLMAAAGVWKVKAKAPVQVLPFRGQYAAVTRPANYLWGTGDGRKPSGNAIAIARDAVVVIVARHSKIPALGQHEDESYLLDYPSLGALFAAGYTANSVKVYTLSKDSGTRRFVTEKLGEGKPAIIGKGAVEVADDLEMIAKVAKDPYGIGYCSAAMIEPEKVAVIGLRTPDYQTHYYPQDYPKGRWVVPDKPTWPWTRTLYAVYGGKAWQADGSGIANVMLAPSGAGTQALQAGPLFGTGYWKP